MLLPNWKNRYSLSFDGVNEGINIDAVRTALATTTVGTFSVWIRPVDATPASANSIIAFGDTNANERLLINITTGGLCDCFLTIAGTNQWGVDTDAAAFSDNTWKHIALVQDGVSPVLYVNSSAVAQAFYVTTNKTRWFNNATGLDNGRIACNNFNNNGNAQFINGNIDEVSFFNTNLSAAQISELYNGGKPKNVLKHSASTSLVSYFRNGDGDAFDGTNWILYDKKGTNNGTSFQMESNDISSIVP